MQTKTPAEKRAQNSRGALRCSAKAPERKAVRSLQKQIQRQRRRYGDRRSRQRLLCEICEQLFGRDRLRGLQRDAEAATRIVFVGRRVFSASEKLRAEFLQLGIESCARFRDVWREKAVVDEKVDFRAGETDFPVELRLGCELLVRIQRGARGLLEPVLICAVERRLAIVKDAELAFRVVQAVIGLMADQHYAGAIEHVAIIGDIEKQFFERLFLNPAMEDGNKWLKSFFRAFDEQLYVYVLHFQLFGTHQTVTAFPSWL